MKRIFIVEDDRGWIECYERFLSDYELVFFRDGLAAVNAMNEIMPDLILLDVMLVGPTGFAILNEMQSYPELANVPIIIASSIDFKEGIAEQYKVVRIFDKSKMMPMDLLKAVQRILG